MTVARRGVCWLGLAASAGLALCSAPASAHSFGRTYTLPVPIWLYLYGAAASLVLSFVVVGWFVNARAARAYQREYIIATAVSPWLIDALRCISAGALAITIAAGFLGTGNPYDNINMTLFWVMFCLGFTYFTALAGDWYSEISPFRTIADGIGRLRPRTFSGRFRYPQRLGHWPALLLYMAFIWIELFGQTTPFTLSVALASYLALTLAGCWLVGRDDWFEHVEFFGVFLRLIAKIAPVGVETRRDGSIERIALRQPFIGLLHEDRHSLSLLLFVLFMLSSTAFDGLKETALWIGGFWRNLYQLVLIPLFGDASKVPYSTVSNIFLVYQSATLLLSPFIYLAIYALFLYFARRLTRTTASLGHLLLSFSYCLIPIAFVYHLTHYYTLLQIQAPQMKELLSDPLGQGWNLFGTSGTAMPVIPDLGVVWHVQVFAIIAGHIVSVYLAHLQALRLFADHRTALLSQLPTLLLMVGFTTVGLWILSLPLESGVLP